MSRANIKAFELRKLTTDELLKKLDECKNELSALRIQKVVGNSSKNSKIFHVRKNIARVLTVYNQKKKAELRQKYAGKRYVPYNLRPKLTKKRRLALTNIQKKKLTTKRLKVALNFPKRKFYYVPKDVLPVKA